MLHELHAHHAFAQLRKQNRGVHRADLTFAVQDHTVATKPGRGDDTNPSGTAFIKAMREGCREFGIRLFDVDDPDQGISHVVAPELGIVLPERRTRFPTATPPRSAASGRSPSAAAPAS